MRAIVVDSLAKSLAEISRMLAGDLELARAFSAAVDDWHGATDDERTRALFVFQALFKLLENAWFQKRQGTLDPEEWEGWDAIIRVYYHRPGVKAWSRCGAQPLRSVSGITSKTVSLYAR